MVTTDNTEVHEYRKAKMEKTQQTHTLHVPLILDQNGSHLFSLSTSPTQKSTPTNHQSHAPQLRSHLIIPAPSRTLSVSLIFFFYFFVSLAFYEYPTNSFSFPSLSHCSSDSFTQFFSVLFSSQRSL